MRHKNSTRKPICIIYSIQIFEHIGVNLSLHNTEIIKHCPVRNRLSLTLSLTCSMIFIFAAQKITEICLTSCVDKTQIFYSSFSLAVF